MVGGVSMLKSRGHGQFVIFFLMPCFGNFCSCLGLVVCAAVGGSISMEEGDAAGAAVFFAFVFCLKLCMTLSYYLSSLTLIFCHNACILQSACSTGICSE